MVVENKGHRRKWHLPGLDMLFIPFHESKMDYKIRMSGTASEASQFVLSMPVAPTPKKGEGHPGSNIDPARDPPVKEENKGDERPVATPEGPPNSNTPEESAGRTTKSI